MTVLQIFPIEETHTFNDNQAEALVDNLLLVTAKAKNIINSLNTKIEVFKHDLDRVDQYQEDLNREIQKWSDRVRRIGGTPLALYKVKINSDAGFYTWEYPSAELIFNSH